MSVLIYSYPAPDDYMPGPIVLTLTGSGGTAMVNIVNDTVLEVDEMFDMMLSSNDPSVLIVEDTATVTINDSGEVFLSLYRYLGSRGPKKLSSGKCVLLEGVILTF